MIVNTSFNINNEPLVCTVEDAYKCFMITDLDYLVCGNYLLDRRKQF
jgi:carbamoyltransferase